MIEFHSQVVDDRRKRHYTIVRTTDQYVKSEPQASYNTDRSSKEGSNDAEETSEAGGTDGRVPEARVAGRGRRISASGARARGRRRGGNDARAGGGRDGIARRVRAREAIGNGRDVEVIYDSWILVRVRHAYQ